jgi:hypothetical protein
VPRVACLGHRVDSPKLGSRRAAALWRQLCWAAAGGLASARAEPTAQHRLACGAITKKFVRSRLKMWQGRWGRHIAQCSHPWARQSRQGRRCHAAPLAFSPNVAMGKRATVRLRQLQTGPVRRARGSAALSLYAAPEVRPASSCASTETVQAWHRLSENRRLPAPCLSPPPPHRSNASARVRLSTRTLTAGPRSGD